MPRRRRSSASGELSSLSLAASPQAASFASSSEASPAPSLIFSSTSPSPASSLTSSPSLGPKRMSFQGIGGGSAPGAVEPLSLGAPLQPSSVELAKYASDIIRNEAYALLALAARLAPAAYPLLDDEGSHTVRAGSDSGSRSLGGVDSSDEGSYDGGADEADPKSPAESDVQLDESRTNQAFRNVVNLVQSMPRHGKVLVSGIGKSGIVARKMVATFCSLGAFPLPPAVLSSYDR